jgi:DNA-binding response OmpR family regulator
MRILYLEDEPVQRQLAMQWMQTDGHNVRAVEDGREAIQAIERDSFDIAVLDWEVPPPTGADVLRWIRSRGLYIPVMFVTSHGDEKDIVAILESGADDYLVKPARRHELVARLRALARRAGLLSQDRVVEVGPYRVDITSRAVYLNGEAVSMRPRAVDLAVLLFRKLGQVVSRAEIRESVWGTTSDLETRTIDTHVSMVRKALKLDGSHGLKLQAVYQHGYRLDSELPAE